MVMRENVKRENVMREDIMFVGLSAEPDSFPM